MLGQQELLSALRFFVPVHAHNDSERVGQQRLCCCLFLQLTGAQWTEGTSWAAQAGKEGVSSASPALPPASTCAASSAQAAAGASHQEEDKLLTFIIVL